MKVLSTEKSKLLAEQQGWTLDYARGYVDGETSRRLGHTPALHALVGIDEFALGFRAAYFERQQAAPARVEPLVRRPAQVRAV